MLEHEGVTPAELQPRDTDTLQPLGTEPLEDIAAVAADGYLFLVVTRGLADVYLPIFYGCIRSVGDAKPQGASRPDTVVERGPQLHAEGEPVDQNEPTEITEPLENEQDEPENPNDLTTDPS